VTESQLQQIQPPKRGKRSIDDEICDKEIEDCRIVREKANGNGSHEPQPQYCHCAEYVINGKREPFPFGHSCEYVASRNWLIDDAVREANKRVGDPADDASLWQRWAAAYNSAMNRLCYNAGLLR
jgi:hypothetical protein